MDRNNRIISIHRPGKGEGLYHQNLGAKQLINKLVNFRTIDGERTRACAIAHQTFHRSARTERDVTKLLVNAVENIKPICEVGKVRVAGTTHNVPEIAARDRQQTLAIRWILGAAFKRRISNRIGSDKCSSAEIPEFVGSKKQPADCAPALPPGLHSLCEQGLGTEGLYGLSNYGQVDGSRRH
eukprot:Gb_34448 [translate_table: standard]